MFLERLNIFFILFSLLFCVGCKQTSVVTSLPKAKGKEKIFTPISDAEAKRIIGSRNTDNTLLSHNELKALRDVARQKEAKLSDIPIPINADPIPDFFTDSDPLKNQIVLGYRSNMSINDVSSFYIQEMERLGWRKLVAFNGFETLLNFKKPNKFCSISIRTCSCDYHQGQEHVLIIIFVIKV